MNLFDLPCLSSCSRKEKARGGPDARRPQEKEEGSRAVDQDSQHRASLEVPTSIDERREGQGLPAHGAGVHHEPGAPEAD